MPPSCCLACDDGIELVGADTDTALIIQQDQLVLRLARRLLVNAWPAYKVKKILHRWSTISQEASGPC